MAVSYTHLDVYKRQVLVNPIGGREFVGTYVNRALERPVMRLMGVRRAR